MIKNKVILVHGQRHITESIDNTTINADYVVLITALRFPHFIPAGLGSNPNELLDHVIDVLEHFAYLNQRFLISLEYANAIVDRKRNVQIVEGQSMNVSWFYNIIRAFHKNMGQTIVEVKTEADRMHINEVLHSWEAGLNLLRCQSLLD